MCSQVPVTYAVRLEPRDAGAFVIRYVVNVTELSVDAERSWSVMRRYTDFKTLHTGLQHADIELPSMPDKSFFRKAFNAEFREQRLQQLNEILQAAVSIDPELKSTSINSFLCLGQEFRKPDQDPDEDVACKGSAALSKHENEKSGLSCRTSSTLFCNTQLQSLAPALDLQDAETATSVTPAPPSPVHLCDSGPPSPTKRSVLSETTWSGGAVGSDWTVLRSSDKPETPELGDLVSLTRSVLPEFAGHKAVVTKTFESHCAVAVLDNSCSYGVGEYWPNHEDISIVSRSWRLGMQVTLVGFRGAKTRHLNGLHGVIVEHPRSGYPSFICKDACPDRPVLTFCIRLHKPENSGQRTVLVEPKFMQPVDDKFKDAVEQLGKIVHQH